MTEDNNPSPENRIQPAIIIRAQTAEEEFKYLTRTLKRMPFYRQNGYTVALPEDPVFKEIVQKSQDDLRGMDQKALKLLFFDKIYDPSFFEPGIQKLEKARQTIESALPVYEELNQMWGFQLFPVYDIALTRYGPGGFYNLDDPTRGKIVVQTDAMGTFRRSDPASTPIHESVHLGIEDTIVRKFNLTHEEKERMVDLMCRLKFAHILPNYKLQKIGDTRIDSYVNLDTINDLPGAIARYVQEFPR